ncbi:molybdopterin molybdotransferase MoeA [Ruficoccus amylovorans]|uniref:Molybdopterin molybdenumtransferase n=1 Tax=Ruficoccus amylovorans TaxID=1804625 RepID=A0A842HHK5_9BACT|nr:molybdopterin molybdotransferase MoeA [Ruficoccus amylovorans]MBC2595478.1 molybdopterin molybdotransferase MoeA [Ruficoccus amylovorans]
MPELIRVCEADRRLAECQRLAPTVSCPLASAVGRVLRQSVIADRDLPPFDRVMMDGYAINTGRTAPGAILPVAGRSDAGAPQATLPPAPVAWEVMTGAPLPEHADAVVPYEAIAPGQHAGSIHLPADGQPVSGAFIHRRGSDYAAGATLLSSGTLLGPAEIGIAASCGLSELLVSEHPRLAVFATGDELVDVYVQPASHQIRQSNAYALEAALTLSGYPVSESARLADETASEDRIREAVDKHDVVIIAGAASRGRRDWAAPLLDSLATRVFHGIRQHPGKPLGLWCRPEGKLIFLLPGNPVAALTGMIRFVLPALSEREGRPLRHAYCSLREPPAPTDFTRYLPVRLSVLGPATAVAPRNSGDYARLAGTDGFIEIPSHQSPLPSTSHFRFYAWK